LFLFDISIRLTNRQYSKNPDWRSTYAFHLQGMHRLIHNNCGQDEKCVATQWLCATRRTAALAEPTHGGYSYATFLRLASLR
jgi:hypothetical protein